MGEAILHKNYKNSENLDRLPASFDCVSDQVPLPTISLDALLPEDQPADLVRIPANSKSRTSLEDHSSYKEQHRFCNSFLASVGFNRDLAPRVGQHEWKEMLPYAFPPSQAHVVPHHPEMLGTDVYRCSPCDAASSTFTIEDKDPSVLWRICNNRVFRYWYQLFENSPDRWEICDYTHEEVIAKYRAILDPILPRNLLPRATAFGMSQLP